MNLNTFASKFYRLGLAELYPTFYNGLFTLTDHKLHFNYENIYQPARKRGTRGKKRIWHNIIHKRFIHERKKAARGVNHQNLISITAQHLLHGGLINARSVNNKADELGELCTSGKYDFLAITETWLRPNTPAHKFAIEAICPNDSYLFLHQHRIGGKRGGGVGFLAKKSLNPSVLSLKSINAIVTTFECLLIQTVHGVFVILYRPPGHCSVSFYSELDSLLALTISRHKQVVVLGDINIHLDLNQPQTVSYKDILSAHDLHNHTTEATHVGGHTLDTVGSSRDKVIYLSVRDIATSDHYLVSFYMPFHQKLSNALPSAKTYLYRDYKSIDNGIFIKQLRDKLDEWETEI